MKPRILFASIFVFAAFTRALTALDPSAWETRQSFTLAQPGAVRLDIPAEALDAARADLADLRIMDAEGGEIPFTLLAELPAQPGKQFLHPINVRFVDDTSVLELVLEKPLSASSIVLTTPAVGFVKSASVELRSATSGNWRRVAENQQIFRHSSGAAVLRFSFEPEPVTAIRVIVDDRKTKPIPFTQITVVTDETPAPKPAVSPVKIVSFDPSANESRIVLDLGARNRPVAGFELVPSDAVFSRSISVVTRAIVNDEARESLTALGTISRINLGENASYENLRVELPSGVADSRVELAIDNGDSPPLSLQSAAVLLRPLHLALHVKSPGSYTLLSGNPNAKAPRYDVAAFAADWRKLPATSATWSTPALNTGFHPAQPAAEIPELAGPFDGTDWTAHRSVSITAPGAQLLELDPAALADACPNFADIRLVRGGRQIPYLIEHTCRTRSIKLQLEPAPDAQKPGVGRWKIELPRANVPFNRLAFVINEPLFDRDVTVYELSENNRGEQWARTLGTAHWTRRSADEPARFSINLHSRPSTAVIFLEIHHGDNAPFAPAMTEAFYPVTRLRFRVTETGNATLAYGNPEAKAPRYDLQLAAQRLLAAKENIATLEPAQENASGEHSMFSLNGRTGRWLFWGALALVVVILLWTVAKLLPKPTGD